MKKQSKYVGWILMAALILAVTLLRFSFFQHSPLVIQFQDGVFTAQLNGYSYSADLTKQTEIRLINILDRGTIVNGAVNGNICAGLWENETYGEYALLADVSLPSYVLIQSESQTLIVNTESDVMTRELRQALVSTQAQLRSGTKDEQHGGT